MDRFGRERIPTAAPVAVRSAAIEAVRHPQVADSMFRFERAGNAQRIHDD